MNLHSAEGETVSGEGVWGGRGENRPCHVCGRLILIHEIQIKVDFGAVTPTKTFHRNCYEMWVEHVVSQAGALPENPQGSGNVG